MKFNSDYQSLAHHYIYNNDYSECYGNRMFSENEIMYSYGRHFQISRKIELKGGRLAIIINDDKYGVTTSKQRYCVISASSHLKQFYFNPEYYNDGKAILKSYVGRIKEILPKLKRARQRYDEYLNEISSLQSECIEYFELVKVKLDRRRLTKFERSLLANEPLTEELSNNDDKAIRDRKTRENRARIKAETKRTLYSFKKWSNFEISSMYGRIDGFDKLRFNTVTNELETSQGLSFTLEEIKGLIICLAKGNCQMFKQFKVIQYTDKVLQIGCHKFNRQDVDHFTNLIKSHH